MWVSAAPNVRQLSCLLRSRTSQITRAASSLGHVSQRQGLVGENSTNSVDLAATRHFSEAPAKEDSYFSRKAELKRQRVQKHEDKTARHVQQKTRRAGKPMNVMKTEFRTWWDRRRAYEEMMDRAARKEGLEWQIDVGIILERIPVIMPDKEDWEKEFENLQTHLSQFDKMYPRELTGAPEGTEDEEPEVYTEEELLAMLPEGFAPAPRVTEADKSGDVKTLDRKLQTRIYLAVQDKPDSAWDFPTATLKTDESLIEAAKRGIEAVVGNEMDVYYPSNAPCAVGLQVYLEDERRDGLFGVKTFYMKVQHDEGIVKDGQMPHSDFAWLDKDEMVGKVRDGKQLGKPTLFRYLL